MQRAWSPKAKTGTLVQSPSASINSQTREVALGDHDSVRGTLSYRPPLWRGLPKLVCSPEGGSKVFCEAHQAGKRFLLCIGTLGTWSTSRQNWGCAGNVPTYLGAGTFGSSAVEAKETEALRS